MKKSKLRRFGGLLAAIGLLAIGLKLAFRLSPDLRWAVMAYRDEAVRAVCPIAPKLWAHRCNDTRKLEEMMALYDGVEMDITFYPSADGGRFDTSHDPQPSPAHPLDDFFAAFAPPHETKVWLDFKNLNEKNAAPALRELERLTAAYRIDKARLVVESGNWPYLAAFREKGYYTSYYCPVDTARYLKTDAHRAEYFEKVRAAARSGHVDAVSFPASYYELVKASGVDADLLVWHTRGERWWRFFVEPALRRMLGDDQVKAILVNAPSRYSR